jgi:hypothetical protein
MHAITASVSQAIGCGQLRRLMSNELESIRKKLVMAYFRKLFLNLLRGHDEKCELSE